MVTLHSTTELIKNILKWGSIAIGTIVLIVLLFRGGSALIRMLFPKPPTPPTVAFGKLPPVLFPQSSIKKTFTYSLDTVSGDLPSFGTDRAKVFKTVQAQPNLLNLEDARAKVGSVRFKVGERVITDTVYQWTSEEKSDKKIIFNIVSNDFTLNSNFFSYPEVLAANNLPSEDTAKKNAENFLKSMKLLPEDLDLTKTTTQLLAIQNATIFPATSLSTAQLVRVDFYQKDIEKMKIYYPYPPFSTMNIFIGSGGNNGQIIQSQFYHQTISKESATYPIKTAEKAFEELKKGKGYIAAYYGEDEKVVIKQVTLAYYLGEEKQNFLMPIIVFEGDNGFFAYISAVEEEWITE